MTLEQKPEGEQSGFETSGEIRRGPFPQRRLDVPFPPSVRPKFRWGRLLVLLVLVVVVGLVIYFLVTSL
jgi:hypothetical protein